MFFAVIFRDNPNADPALRARHMADHLKFLEANATHIQAAGPLAPDTITGPGGLWLVEAESSAEVQALIEADPFWLTGLRV